ncbi:hypothetical protein AVEN_111418-1 [Araneus ventricosus]|uniref:Uncharacterized protein n=1 Tax=Araneus ventricosus TaxID=182803 RepID=A0A4Y2UP19_ARAVE|nr:hypothetical protein AVEN_134432-1 [Araneus ventricosus]GBO13280.1 hypothetical protein AVEN_191279-1 [Araneus ventricosus]GBO13287.1 hypothetical protein AVEN_111418-1 [Araneus ventricosus]
MFSRLPSIQELSCRMRTDLVILNRSQMTRMTLSWSSTPQQTEDVRPTTSDLTYTRLAYTVDLWWNRVSSLGPFEPETFPLRNRSPEAPCLFIEKIHSHMMTHGKSRANLFLFNSRGATWYRS